MGAHDSAAVNKDQHETGKVVDAVIEDQQLVMSKVHDLAVKAEQPACAGIDFSICFSTQIHVLPVNVLYPLARSLCRNLPADCRVRSELVDMLALRSEPLPDPSVEDAAAQTICGIISKIFMPFVEARIAPLLVLDPGRGDLRLPQAAPPADGAF
jgi:hypothetical protein